MSKIAARFKKAFSTLVCPNWTVSAIVDGAKAYGYEGVELVVGENHGHGIELDKTEDVYADMRQKFDAGNLALACIGTPCEFASPEPSEREEMLALAKRYLQLADRLGCPYIRVQGGIFPIDMEPVGVIDYIADTLSELTEYAEDNFATTILVQTNQGLSNSRFTRELIKQVYSDKLKVVWDIANCTRVLESEAASFDNLSEHIRMVYVQDFDYSDDRADILVADPGAGFVDMPKAISYLKRELFHGFLTVNVLENDPDADRIMKTYSEYLNTLL